MAMTKKESGEYKHLKKSIAAFEREWGGPQVLENIHDTKTICTQVHQNVTDKQIIDPIVYNAMYNSKKNKNAQKLSKEDQKFMLKSAEQAIKNSENMLHPYLNEDQKEDIIKAQIDEVTRRKLTESKGKKGKKGKKKRGRK